MTSEEAKRIINHRTSLVELADQLEAKDPEGPDTKQACTIMRTVAARGTYREVGIVVLRFKHCVDEVNARGQK